MKFKEFIEQLEEYGASIDDYEVRHMTNDSPEDEAEPFETDVTVVAVDHKEKKVIID